MNELFEEDTILVFAGVIMQDKSLSLLVVANHQAGVVSLEAVLSIKQISVSGIAVRQYILTKCT